MGQPAGSFNPPQPISVQPGAARATTCWATAAAAPRWPASPPRATTRWAAAAWLPRATIAASAAARSDGAGTSSRSRAPTCCWRPLIGFSNDGDPDQELLVGRRAMMAPRCFGLGPLAEPRAGQARRLTRARRPRHDRSCVRRATAGPSTTATSTASPASRFVLAVGAVGDDALAGALQRGMLGALRGGAVERRRPQHHDHGPPRRTRATTRPPASYTDRFGGTAAAAPVVSGTVALMLAAQPRR